MFKEKEKTMLFIKRLVFITVGTFCMSIAINALYIPHNILSGGVTGIAILFNILLGLNSSLVIVLFNIPIFILGFVFLNKRFLLWSLAGMGSLSFFVWITQGISIESEALLTTILLGGVMYGVGFGLILRVGASSGGNDIISKIINKNFSFSIPTINFSLNVIVVALSAFFFGIDEAVKTLTTMYVASVVMHFVLEGINYKRTAIIISDKKAEIVSAINHKLSRGCTVMCATGGYTGKSHDMLYCVIGIHQLAKLRMLVNNIDSHAFMNVMESRAVFGNGRGFIKIDDEDS